MGRQRRGAHRRGAGEAALRLTLLSRYFHTLRYLHPVQVYGRLWFRLYRPRPDWRPAPPLRVSAGPWITPPASEPRLLGPATFRFLNQTGALVEADDALIQSPLPYSWGRGEG